MTEIQLITKTFHSLAENAMIKKLGYKNSDSHPCISQPQSMCGLDLGYDGVCRSISTQNFELWKGQKLRIIILPNIGLVTFDFHFPKIRQVFIFLTFGTSGNVRDPQKPLFLTLDPPSYSK